MTVELAVMTVKEKEENLMNSEVFLGEECGYPVFEFSTVVRVDYYYYLCGFVVMRMGTGHRKSKEEDDSSEDAGSFSL